MSEDKRNEVEEPLIHEEEMKDNTENEKAEIKEEKSESEVQEKSEAQETEAEAQQPEDSSVKEELSAEAAKLKDENKKLYNEVEALKDRLLRTTSEYENFRKRTIKEKEGIYTDACEDILKNILPVLDNLERACGVQGNIDDIKKGIDMTLRQFQDALKKLSVEEIQTESGFDPNQHNAVMHIEDESLGKNAVVEVFQKGYKRGSKVLRHSMVKVAN